MRAILSMIKNDDLAVLEKFLEKPDSDLNTVIKFRSVTIPDVLRNGPSLICAAAYFASIECFRYLYLNGANMDFVDSFGRHLIHFAVAGGNLEILRILSDNNCVRTDAVDMEGNTIVHYAAMFKRQNVLYWLWTTENVPLDTLNNRKMSPLHIAATNEDIKMLNFLCVNGCNVNQKNDVGLTPLHIAACKPNIELLKALIENGADMKIRDNSGCLPYHWAILMRHQHIQNFLMDTSAIVNNV